MIKNITTPWSFNDGREYIISLNVVDHPTSNASLSLKLADKITAEEWSCSYDAKYIENLTHRTGSFKPFHVFISMVQSALLKKSDSVALDLTNLTDLENLRAQKGASSTTTTLLGGKFNNLKPNGELNSSFSDHLNTGNGIKDKCQNNESGSSKKKYLIVTYVAEFDKVHFPIPLNYSGPPNLQVMQKNILQLRSEVVSLRNAKTTLEEEVVLLKQTQGLNRPTSCNSMTYKMFQPTNEVIMDQKKQHQIHEKMNAGFDFAKTECRCPEDEALHSKLTQKIGCLEEALAQERADHQDRFEKLQAENDFFRRKLEASEKYEQRLEDEIYVLTNGGSSTRAHKSGIYNVAYKEKWSGLQKKVGLLNIGNSGDNGFPKGTRNLTNLGRIRSRSPGISPLPRRSRSFSPSPNRRPSFDPTAYIREKKLKQDRMAQLRLDKIRAQLQARDSSSSSSRSVSRESRGSQSGRAFSRSPHRRIATTTTTPPKLKSLYTEIDERLSRERNRSLGRRNGLVKSTTNSQLPTSLYSRVENLVGAEFPRLGRIRSKKHVGGDGGGLPFPSGHHKEVATEGEKRRMKKPPIS